MYVLQCENELPPINDTCRNPGNEIACRSAHPVTLLFSSVMVSFRRNFVGISTGEAGLNDCSWPAPADHCRRLPIVLELETSPGSPFGRAARESSDYSVAVAAARSSETTASSMVRTVARETP